MENNTPERCRDQVLQQRSFTPCEGPLGGCGMKRVRAGDSSTELRSLSNDVVPLPSANTLGTTEREVGLTCSTWGSLAKEILEMEWDEIQSSCPFTSPSSTSTIPAREGQLVWYQAMPPSEAPWTVMGNLNFATIQVQRFFPLL